MGSVASVESGKARKDRLFLSVDNHEILRDSTVKTKPYKRKEMFEFGILYICHMNFIKYLFPKSNINFQNFFIY